MKSSKVTFDSTLMDVSALINVMISSKERASRMSDVRIASKFDDCSLGSISGGTFRSSGSDILKTEDMLETGPADLTSFLSNETCLLPF